jgi:hypothetical protein
LSSSFLPPNVFGKNWLFLANLVFLTFLAFLLVFANFIFFWIF